jgi:hypothetical protein
MEGRLKKPMPVIAYGPVIGKTPSIISAALSVRCALPSRTPSCRSCRMARRGSAGSRRAASQHAHFGAQACRRESHFRAGARRASRRPRRALSRRPRALDFAHCLAPRLPGGERLHARLQALDRRGAFAAAKGRADLTLAPRQRRDGGAEISSRCTAASPSAVGPGTALSRSGRKSSSSNPFSRSSVSPSPKAPSDAPQYRRTRPDPASHAPLRDQVPGIMIPRSAPGVLGSLQLLLI